MSRLNRYSTEYFEWVVRRFSAVHRLDPLLINHRQFKPNHYILVNKYHLESITSYRWKKKVDAIVVVARNALAARIIQYVLRTRRRVMTLYDRRFYLDRLRRLSLYRRKRVNWLNVRNRLVRWKAVAKLRAWSKRFRRN